MKRCYKILGILIVLITIGGLSGCKEKEKTASSDEGGNIQKEVTVCDDNGTKKTITDMGGRTVEFDTEIKKVYGANPMATILLFTLVPDKIIGWNEKLPNQEILPEAYKNLPVVGSMGTKQQAASAEEILTYNPDLILYAQAEINKQSAEKADKLSQQLGKPVVLINGSLESTESTYELLGEIFDCSERSNELIQYYKDTLSNIEKTKSEIKEEEKIKVYYGKEEDALTTSGKESVHAKLIELVGGKNVADAIEGDSDAAVNLEEVIKWQPDVILLSEANKNEKNAYQNLIQNTAWENIPAVKNNKVYVSPMLLFSWFDRPPSINELIGIKWLAVTLYPDYYEIDMKSEIKEFYQKYYQIDLKEEVITDMLQQ
ncbi:ABC transporter substrate-binding protein [Anaeromicropila populeti]|uniref:Iron complex transport system substrate-binding protein n=1 Tax=Anaeromicropila populeti TaxID=37658 RepID=A0A1I6IM94_9FIRM|nr:ABC transporter substrate-binding protein [Anaeromicropila populeti]SFR67865.1 iron complex transport system substrate-binding protein [Anaeromicropila populeti]